MVKKLILGVIIILVGLMSTQSSLACTDFRIKALDGTTLITRTLEFGMDLKSNLRTSTRGRTFTQTTPNNKPGLTWKAKYGYIFLDGLNVDAAIDGMNEKGLSIEALYLPGETQYQTIPVGRENQGLSYLNFGDWILGNFQTVDEVRHALSNIYVYSQAIAGMGNIVFPLHFAIYDATGKSMIVEFVKGKMEIYDNEIGVMTNSPTYNWQITNLRNYINMSPVTPNPVTFGNLVFAATGQGAGMKGLPGDVSPPSRFVKISVMKAATYSARTSTEALNIAQHIINNVDIPSGYVRANYNGKTTNETTQWIVFKDLTNKVFYYKTYDNTTLHSVGLLQIDLSENAPRLKMPIADSQFVLDMTNKFLQSK